MRVLVLGCKDYPAFSTPWVHSGGMEVYVERMVRSLSDRARFTLYTAGGRSDAHARATTLGAARGLRTQPLSLMIRSRRRLAVDGPVYDVLNPQSPLSALAALAEKRRRGVPYVVTVHIFGSDPAHAGGRWAARIYSRIEQLVFSHAAAIIPTGRRLAATLADRYPQAKEKITLVKAAGTGVQHASPAAEVRPRLGIPPEARCLLFLGRLVEENGLRDLLEAVAHLRKRDPRVLLLVAGSGDRETEVVRRADALGLDGAVRRLGVLRGQEKFDVLAAADLVVRTSRHEVFPEAYVEALSVGTGVAATPAGDTPELAAESGAVMLLPVGDPLSQAAAIEDLLLDGERRAVMRKNALEYAERVHWNDQKEIYWRVLQGAAGHA